MKNRWTSRRLLACSFLVVLLGCCLITGLSFRVAKPALETLAGTYYDDGEAHYDQHNCTDAIRSFRTASTLFQASGNKQALASSLLYLGLCSEEIGEYENAKTWSTKSIEICQELNDLDCIGVNKEVLANVEYDKGNYPLSLEIHSQALDLFLATQYEDQLASTYHNIANIYSILDKHDLAIVNFENSASVYSQAGNKYEEQQEYEKIAQEYEITGNYVTAISYYEKQLSTIREDNTDTSSFEARALQNLGLLYARTGNYDRALDYYLEAIEWEDSNSMYHPQARAEEYINIGALYLSWKKYDLATQYNMEALDLARQYGYDWEETSALTNLGSIASETGDFEKAIRYQLQAVEVAKRNGDNFSLATISFNLGGDYDGLGDSDTATNYYLDSKKFLEAYAATGKQFPAEPSSTDLLLPEIYLQLGDVYINRNDYENGLSLYTQALNLGQQKHITDLTLAAILRIAYAYNDIGDSRTADEFLEKAKNLGSTDPLSQIRILSLAGSIQQAQGDQQAAADYFESALTLAEQHNDKETLAGVLFDYGEVLKARGNLDNAIDLYERGLEIENTRYQTLRVPEFKGTFNAGLASYYEDLVSLLWTTGNYENAFHYAEQARARAFLDELGNGPIDFTAHSSSDLLDEEKSLKEEIISLHEQLDVLNRQPEDQQDQTLIDRIKAQLSEKENEYSQLLTNIKLQSPEIFSLVSVDVLSVAQIQSYLDLETTLVEYFITDERLFVFVIDHDTFDATMVDVSREKLIEISDHLISFSDLNDPYPQGLQLLYDWLIAPVSANITTKRIAIVPHGVLHHVPFAALTNGQTYLIQNYSIFVLPSGSSIQLIQNKKTKQSDPILLLGNPTITEAAAPLIFAEREVRNIARLYAKSELLIGDQATETIVVQKAGASGILHIAAHTKLNSGNPLFSAILLTPDDQNDGRLEVHEIYGMNLKNSTDLVVLSACQTQIGKMNPGDEVIGLTRAFIYAGSPTVISSLWTVDDTSTAALMTSFYSYLVGGRSKAEALRLAQLDVRGEHPSPYYWAGFVLTGNP